MYAAFVKLLNMSAASGILIAAVILLRLLLRKAPKKYICLLWAIAAFRLCCPVNISSAVSAYNLFAPQSGSRMEYIRYSEVIERPAAEVPVFRSDDAPEAAEAPQNYYLPTAVAVWAAGLTGMLGYAAVSYLRLHRQTAEAVRLRENIYRCDHLPSPFILGIVRPKIYLPSDLKEPQRQSVIAHEQAHLRRLDHWWKPMGFAILSVHWFNPLVWVGYALLSRDIETACDERVIEKMSTKQKQEYSETLLQCSMPQKFISACPLAFGETGVKQRIKGILNYRKPTAWIAVLSLLICLFAAAAFLTDPVTAETAPALWYKLQIGCADVFRITVQTSNGSGSCSNADGSAFAVDELVYLERLEGVRDLSGVTLQAYAEDGTLLWAASAPEMADGNVCYLDGWTLYRNLEDQPEAQEATHSESIRFTGMVSSGALNVRSAPSTSAPAVDKLDGGTVVDILEVTEVDGVEWGRIGEDRWVVLDYIMIIGVPLDSSTSETEAASGEIEVYSSPSTQSHLIGTLNPGEAFTVLRTESVGPKVWQYISSGNMAGWMTAPQETASGSVIVRSSPSNNAREIGTLTANDGAIILRTENIAGVPWHYVSAGNAIGWVMADELDALGIQAFDTAVLPDSVSDSTIYVSGTYATVSEKLDGFVNIRSGPGAQYATLFGVGPGTPFMIQEIVTEDGTEWGQIGENQWIAMDFVDMDSEPTYHEAPETIPDSDGIPLRSSPSTQARIIGTLSEDNNALVLRTETLGNTTWLYVSENDMTGWVIAEEISKG